MDDKTYRHRYDDEIYSDEDLMEMLKGRNIRDIYFAMKAIGRRKIKIALPELEIIALHDEDLSIQKEAILTIRKIGGKKGFKILRVIRATGDKEFAQEMLDIKDTSDLDVY